MFEAVGDVLSSALSGGVTGLLGAGLSAWVRSGEQKRTQTHELAMREADRAEMELEYNLRAAEAEQKADAATAIATQQAVAEMDRAEVDLRKASYRHDRATYGPGLFGRIVDGIRGVVRPFVTAYVLMLVTYIAWVLVKVMGGVEGLPMEEVVRLFARVVDSILYLANVVIIWWFGERAVQKARAGQ